MADPFEKTRRLALYQFVGPVAYTFVSEYHGEEDVTHHPKDCIRISEPLEVCFRPMCTQEARDAARASLDAEEERLRDEMESRLKAIRQKRAELADEVTEAA